jgi:hypothetical protein
MVTEMYGAMLRPSDEVESVPIEGSMPAAPESSRGVDKQACTEAVALQENTRFLHTYCLARSVIFNDK